MANAEIVLSGKRGNLFIGWQPLAINFYSEEPSISCVATIQDNALVVTGGCNAAIVDNVLTVSGRCMAAIENNTLYVTGA